MKNFKKSIIALTIALSCLSNTEAQTNAKTQGHIKIDGVKGESTHARTSMTATVGKQNMQVAIIDGGCVISFPPHKAYRVNTANNTMVEISQAEFGDRVNAGLQQAGGVVSGAAGMLGGAMPGGSIVSAALSAGSSMVNGGASSAAYASTGRTAGWNLRTSETRLQLPANLPDGDYELTVVIADQSKSGVDTQVHLPFNLTNGNLAILKTKPNSTSAGRLKLKEVFITN
jgi:hypothetical protein